MTTATRSQSIMNQILDGSAASQDPLSNTSLLATAGVQELLEGIRRQFQPLDADFAEQIHRELHQELLTLPKSWEDGQHKVACK
jgi:fido (protein-threonine AMPylation protein)